MARARRRVRSRKRCRNGLLQYGMAISGCGCRATGLFFLFTVYVYVRVGFIKCPRELAADIGCKCAEPVSWITGKRRPVAPSSARFALASLREWISSDRGNNGNVNSLKVEQSAVVTKVESSNIEYLYFFVLWCRTKYRYHRHIYAPIDFAIYPAYLFCRIEIVLLTKNQLHIKFLEQNLELFIYICIHTQLIIKIFLLLAIKYC